MIFAVPKAMTLLNIEVSDRVSSTSKQTFAFRFNAVIFEPLLHVWKKILPSAYA